MKPAGAIVSIYYDARVDLVDGDALRTPTGRTYVVMASRRQQRGKHRGRWHLRCLVLDRDDQPPPGATVHPIHWYRR